MKLVPTAEERELRDTLRSVLTRECPTSLVRAVRSGADETGKLWRALTETGVFGLAIPERYGGAGAGLPELGVFFTEAGRALCPPIVTSTLAFGVALNRLGTDEQRERYLPALVQGSLTGTLAAWNPSDALDLTPTLTAERSRDGWLLSGTLPAVPHAAASSPAKFSERAALSLEPIERTARSPGTGPALSAGAGLALVTARAGDRPLGFLVEPSAWRAEPRRTIAGDVWSNVHLDQVDVPEDAALDLTGLPGVARAVVALRCAELAGGAQAVLERTVAHVGQREQFGRPIGSFQAVQHMVADLHIALAGAQLAAAHALFRLGRGELATREVAIAKTRCSTAYTDATLTAHQLHGGMGFVRETDLHLWSERAKVGEVRDGTADVAARWLRMELGLAAG